MTSLGSYEHRYLILGTPGFSDGDTLYLSIDQGYYDGNRKQVYRLANIDAPEESTPERTTSNMTEPLQIPSKEAIEYGRRVILKELERYRKFVHKANQNGDHEIAMRHAMRSQAIAQLLGGGGCVIAPFDERWLDNNFRDSVQSAYNDLPTESQ
jgi:hypothetical protein